MLTFRRSPRSAATALFIHVLLLPILWTLQRPAHATPAAEQTSVAPAPAGMTIRPNMPHANSGVNLSTGNAEFSVALASIGGRSGLAYTVTADYSSNVQTEVRASNSDKPTGAMGLGWKLDFPKISVDSKNTGNREDDRFYLEQAGNRLLLVRSGSTGQPGSAGEGYLYSAKAWTTRKIVFYPASQRWEITQDSGITSIFGDTARAAKQQTLQWGVRIGNWIGPTKYGSAGNCATRFPLVYNLAALVEPRGDHLDFYYENIERKIGSDSALSYTRESYLKEVRNSSDFNDRIVLTYDDKSGFQTDDSSTQEYVDPHLLGPYDSRIRGGFPLYSFYQDRFETRYLSSVASYRNGSSSYTNRMQLVYGDADTGSPFLQDNKKDFVKRVLTEMIGQRTDGMASGPSTRYEYYANETDANFGALKKVTTPNGGEMVYTYATKVPAMSTLDMNITRPDGYNKVRTWIGEGYVVVMWVQTSADGASDNILLQTWSWEGRWIKANETALRHTLGWQSVKLALGADFFALLRDTDLCSPECAELTRVARNPAVAGNWSVWQNKLDGASALANAENRYPPFSNLDIAAGERFVVVGGFQYPGATSDLKSAYSVWHTDSAAEYPRLDGGAIPGTANRALQAETTVRAHNNYFIQAIVCTLNCNTNNVNLQLVYITELGQLTNGSTLALAPEPGDTPSTLAGLEAGDGFAAAVVGLQLPKGILLKWAGDFTGLTKIVESSLIESAGGNVIRLAGNTVGFGSQLWQVNLASPHQSSAATVAPASGADDIKVVVGPEYGAGSQLRTYRADLDIWDTAEMPVARALNPAQDFIDFVPANLSARRIRERNAQGSWNSAPYSGSDFHMAISGQQDLRSFQRATGLDYMTLNRKAGIAYEYSVPGNDWHLGASHDARHGHLLTADLTVVAWQQDANATGDPEDAIALHLYRALPSYREAGAPAAFAGRQAVRVVTQVETRSGYENVANAGRPAKVMTIAYDTERATMDPAGRFARFNEVRMHQGAGDDNLPGTLDDAHFGFTTMFFFNGLNPLNWPDSAADQPADQNQPLPHFSVDAAANSQDNYALLDGTPYYSVTMTEKFDATRSKWVSDKTADESTQFYFVRKTNSMNGRPCDCVAIFMTRQVSGHNGVSFTGSQTFDLNSGSPTEGYLRSNSSTRLNADQEQETVTNEFKYALEVYPDAPANSLGASVAQVTTRRSSVSAPTPQTVAVSATTFQDWGDQHWGPVTSWVWRKGISASEQFDFSSPNSDWQRGALPSRVNRLGLIEESTATYGTPAINLYSSLQYDKFLKFVVAQFSGARTGSAGDAFDTTADADYWGMETYENDDEWSRQSAEFTSADANTGKRAISSSGPDFRLRKVFHSQATAANAMQHYVLSAWVKVSTGRTLSMRISAGGTPTMPQAVRSISGAGLLNYPANETSPGADMLADWQYVEVYLHTANASTLTAEVSADGTGVLVDDLRFSPAEAGFNAIVVDPESGNTTALLDKNGRVKRLIADEFGAPYADMAKDGTVAGVTLGYLSRSGNGGVFNPADPNSLTSFIPTEEGKIVDLRNGVATGWSILTPSGAWIWDGCGNGGCSVQNQTLRLQGSGKVYQYALSPSADYAVRFKVNPDNQAEFMVSLSGHERIQYNDTTRTIALNEFVDCPGARRCWRQIASRPLADPLPANQDWLISAVGGRLLVYIEGKKIFDQAGAGGAVDPSFQKLSFQLINGGLTLSNIVLLNQPMIAVAYSDGSDHVLQRVLVDGMDTSVTGYLYNADGQQTVISKSVVYHDHTIDYLPTFLQRDGGGNVSGELLNFYGSNADLQAGYTDDGGFPYGGTPNRAPPDASSSGFSLAGALYNSSAPTGAEHATQFEQHLNTPEDGFKTSAGGAYLPGQYLTSSITASNGAVARALSVAGGETMAAQVARATVYGGQSAPLQALAQRDTQGRTTGIYHPRYFAEAEPADQRSAFITSLGYSDDERALAVKGPDQGTSQMVFNQTGQLRYWMDAVGAAQTPQLIKYAKYDSLGRIIESGTWSKNLADLSTADLENAAAPANSALPGGPPPAIWRKRFIFGVPESIVSENSYEKGRLIGIQTNNSPADSNPSSFDAVSYTHDALGRVTDVTERLGNEGADQLSHYRYNHLSQRTEITYPAPMQAEQIERGNCTSQAPADLSVNRYMMFDASANLQNNVFGMGLNQLANLLANAARTSPNDPYMPEAGGGCTTAGKSALLTMSLDVIFGWPGIRVALTAPLTVRLPSAAAGFGNFDVYSELLLPAAADGAKNGALKVQNTVPAPVLTVTYTYDRQGRLRKVGRKLGAQVDDAWFASYSYGPNGEILSETLNSGQNANARISTSYRYNSPGWLQSIRSTTPDPVSGLPTVRYAQTVRYADARTGAATPETAAYDGKIAAMDQVYNPGGTAEQTLNFTYSYYAEGGLRAAVASGTMADVDRYSYAQPNKDANGNLLQSLRRTRYFNDPAISIYPLGAPTTQDYRYAARTNQMLSQTTSSTYGDYFNGQRLQGFDQNGNVTHIDETRNHLYAPSTGDRRTLTDVLHSTLSYDAFHGKTSQVAGSSQPADGSHQGMFYLTYGDIRDLRISDRYFDGDGGTQHQVENIYFHGGNDAPLEILRIDTAYRRDPVESRKFLIYGATGVIAVLDTDDTSGLDDNKVSFVLRERQSSTVMLLQADGQLQQSYTYTPTGTIYQGDGSAVQTAQVMPYLFQGQQYDWQTGLHDFHARMYDDKSMQFLSPDLAFKVGESPYVAFGNDPVNNEDPDGRVNWPVVVRNLIKFSVVHSTATFAAIWGIAGTHPEVTFSRECYNVSIAANSWAMVDPFGLGHFTNYSNPLNVTDYGPNCTGPATVPYALHREGPEMIKALVYTFTLTNPFLMPTYIYSMFRNLAGAPTLIVEIPRVARLPYLHETKLFSAVMRAGARVGFTEFYDASRNATFDTQGEDDFLFSIEAFVADQAWGSVRAWTLPAGTALGPAFLGAYFSNVVTGSILDMLPIYGHQAFQTLKAMDAASRFNGTQHEQAAQYWISRYNNTLVHHMGLNSIPTLVGTVTNSLVRLGLYHHFAGAVPKDWKWGLPGHASRIVTRSIARAGVTSIIQDISYGAAFKQEGTTMLLDFANSILLHRWWASDVNQLVEAILVPAGADAWNLYYDIYSGPGQFKRWWAGTIGCPACY